MLTSRIAIAALVVCLALISDSAQSQRRPRQQPVAPPSAETAQPPATDQRGTDQSPFSVKILASHKTAEEAEKEERDRRNQDEKVAVDKRLADETQRLADQTKDLADYTRWLAGFTLLLFLLPLVK
jgi:hypothetical protein